MGHRYLANIGEEERKECAKLFDIGEDANKLTAPFAVENAGEHAEVTGGKVAVWRPLRPVLCVR